MSSYINLFHIFIIVPLLYCLYHYRKILPSWTCYLLMIISIGGFIYHSILLKNLDEKKKYMNWIYLLHMIIIFPLLFYIGYNCVDTERKYFEMLLLVIFSALGYHSYNYFKYRK